MSKASEWAERFKAAEFSLSVVKNDRPLAFYLHLVGRASIGIYVDDYGRPNIGVMGVTEDINVSLYADNDRERLLEAARWIIDTFEDKSC